jgi:hypothetical protein
MAMAMATTQLMLLFSLLFILWLQPPAYRELCCGIRGWMAAKRDIISVLKIRQLLTSNGKSSIVEERILRFVFVP